MMPSASASSAADMPPGHDHLERRFRPDQPRQALRAAPARQDADQHFWQANLGASLGNPIVAGERVLEPSAECEAVDGGDHGLVAPVENVVAPLADRRPHPPLAELPDVGTRDERAPRADQHDGA